MLVGRDREQRQIERVLERARSGASSSLALLGEPGIGKTVLLDHAAERADGMQLLRARGIESEARIPFASLLELIRPALGMVELIPGPQAVALESALALRPATAQERFAVGAATLSLLAAYAEGGSSGRHHRRRAMARRFQRASAAVRVQASTGRPDRGSPRHPRGRAVAARRRRPADPANRRSQPSGDDHPARPNRTRCGGSAARGDCGQSACGTRAWLRRERTRARPRRCAAAGVGEGVGRVSAPGGELDDEARWALVLAAASDTGDLTVLERAAGHLKIDLGALSSAENAGLVLVRHGSIQFRHPLARSAIYADASAEERRQAHRALAAALPDRDIDRRAWHLAAAAVGADATASRALQQAGDRARRRSAYATAAVAFERAARLAPEHERRGYLLKADSCFRGLSSPRSSSGRRVAAALSSSTRSRRPERVPPSERCRSYST